MKKGILLAILAAALYAISSPLSKVMLDYMPSTLMAGFLYLGAGISMLILKVIQRLTHKESKEEKLAKEDLPYTIMMIVLDIIAPILLLLGLSKTSASSVSLLNNFEIVATAVIALVVFKEKISKKLWLGIFFICASCCLLSIDDFSSIDFSFGSIYVLLAASCWGLENNCTRKLSDKDPLEIVLLKGIFSGSGALIVGLVIGERLTNFWIIPLVLLLGFFAYGLSIYVYVYAQRLLGASKTSAYYAINPFIGSLLSLLIFKTLPNTNYILAVILMIIGAVLSY